MKKADNFHFHLSGAGFTLKFNQDKGTGEESVKLNGGYDHASFETVQNSLREKAKVQFS